MIDFHSHVIPNIDDGSKNIEMSLIMLRSSVEEGTEFICATSHYIPGEVEVDKKTYEDKLSGLIGLLYDKGIDINVLPALELYMHPELPRLYREKAIWGLNYTKYLLIELPMQQFPIYTEQVLYELRLLGAIPIIAHPERNFRIMKDVLLLKNLVKQGALAQVNAGSLRGKYGKDIKAFAEKLVDMNLIHLVGSDAHDHKRRTTKIKDAFQIIRRRNEKLYNWIIENEHKIIKGLEVERLPIKSKNKYNFLYRLFRK